MTTIETDIFYLVFDMTSDKNMVAFYNMIGDIEIVHKFMIIMIFILLVYYNPIKRVRKQSETYMEEL